MQLSSATRGELIPAAILGMLGSRGPQSRAGLARELDVSPATVTQATRDLIARGLVVELELESSRGGRPAKLLGLATDGGSAVGVKVTADHVATLTTSLAGQVERYGTHPFDPHAPDALDRLERILEKLVSSHAGRLLGIGVGIPGAVDSQPSGVVTAPTLGWRSLPVGARLRDALGVPVLVDNDVNTLAAAELVHGAGRDCANYLVVTIGRGIGCGVVIDRAIYRGAHGGAGEIGHIPVSDDGPICACGATGCLEAVIGEDGLLSRARAERLGGPRASLSSLAVTARKGNDRALALFADAGRLFGRALAGAVHCFDPEVVVIQGEGASDWDLWRPTFEGSFRQHLMSTHRSVPYIVQNWSEERWALGAASLVLAAPFDVAGSSGEQGRLVRARLQSLGA